MRCSADWARPAVIMQSAQDRAWQLSCASRRELPPDGQVTAYRASPALKSSFWPMYKRNWSLFALTECDDLKALAMDFKASFMGQTIQDDPEAKPPSLELDAERVEGNLAGWPVSVFTTSSKSSGNLLCQASRLSGSARTLSRSSAVILLSWSVSKVANAASTTRWLRQTLTQIAAAMNSVQLTCWSALRSSACITLSAVSGPMPLEASTWRRSTVLKQPRFRVSK
mmetsp:Transcript_109408/g.290646  ORF Transcript_109408/g.290646 Transcript_109408/m.290646 type:complete len:226 (-) Transcript_109408:906-1583(-)